MSMTITLAPRRPFSVGRLCLNLTIWTAALLWFLPILVAVWVAIHPASEQGSFNLFAPLTLQNFIHAWQAAPFGRYFLNTIMLVLMIVICQLVLATMAAYALVRFGLKWSGVLFSLILLQLMISPDVLILNNYKTIGAFGLRDSLLGIALPYFASAFAIFCCARRLKVFRWCWKRRPLWKVPAAFIFCAGFIFRWRSRFMWRLRWCRSVFTGTISSGRW